MVEMDIKEYANSGALLTKEYVPGKSKREVERELNLTDTVKMASNENPHGASERGKRAITATLDQIYMYPDPTSFELRNKLAEIHGVAAEEITVGNGADGVIYNLGMAVIDQDDELLIPEITFPVYETITRIMRGRPVFTRMEGLRIDLEEMAAKITDRTKAVFLCNPNNPTGDILPREALREFFQQVPSRVLLVVDEAYIDFTVPEARPDTLSLFKQGMENLVILRTLSKVYGLAGVRLGYGIGSSSLMRLIGRVKPPFDVSLVAEHAGLEALEDQDFITRTLADAAAEKQFFYRELDELGLSYVPSHTNFVLIDTGRDAAVLSRRLLERGLIVRPATGYGLPTSIRVTLNLHEENLRFFRAFREVLAQPSGRS
jgi:histidinol-phosphate aminotransferase